MDEQGKYTDRDTRTRTCDAARDTPKADRECTQRQLKTHSTRVKEETESSCKAHGKSIEHGMGRDKEMTVTTRENFSGLPQIT